MAKVVDFRYFDVGWHNKEDLMIQKSIFRCLALFALIALVACASPQPWDVPTNTKTIGKEKSLFLGKVERQSDEGEVKTWSSAWWEMILGISGKALLVVGGQESNQSVTSDGYFLVQSDNAKIEDLKFLFKKQAKSQSSSASSGGVTVSTSSSSSWAQVRDLATPEKPLVGKPGKINIIGVQIGKSVGYEKYEWSEEKNEARKKELVDWFLKTYPDLAKDWSFN